MLRRAELKARGTPEADANAPLSEGGVAIDVDGGKKKKKGFGLFGKKGKKDAEGDLVVRPPAGPPPGGDAPGVPPPSVPPPAHTSRTSPPVSHPYLPHIYPISTHISPTSPPHLP